MCIIIDNSVGKELPESVIKASISLNPHGYSRLCLETGRIDRIMDMKQARKAFEKPGRAIHHCRYATVGGQKKSNLHPFPVVDGWFLFQNGTVNGFRRNDITDTEQLAMLLRHVPEERFLEVLSHFDSRFLLANKKNGKVLRTEKDWHERDGVFYSKNNVLPGNPLAVYGTLKEGFGNHHLLEDCLLIGKGETMNKHRMAISGIPYVVEGEGPNGEGHNIKVEVYEVDPITLKRVDSLEGHPYHYKRTDVGIWLPEEKRIIHAEMYMTANPSWQKEGPFYAEYTKENSSLYNGRKYYTYGSRSDYAKARASSSRVQTMAERATQLALENSWDSTRPVRRNVIEDDGEVVDSVAALQEMRSIHRYTGNEGLASMMPGFSRKNGACCPACTDTTNVFADNDFLYCETCGEWSTINDLGRWTR